MAKINVLPPEIVSKIAAGEVIERPSSVVKELVENALDAQTDTIELYLKQAGKNLIQINDRGAGIDQADIDKIFLRHSTSKISGIEDLYNISSLGFRGEALYSIGSISDVTLRSKTANQDTGWAIHMRGGEKLGLKPVNMQVGTEIEVKELFFNTPARRKFMKTDTAELNQILNIFIPYAMLYPEVRFLLKHYEKTLLDLHPDKSCINRIAAVLHLKTDHIIEAYKKSDEADMSIRLFLGDINIQRARRDMQFIFVNGRPVQNYSLNFHLNQVYKLVFPQNVYPFFAAFISVPKENLDVNVHPTKREVKIKDDRALVHIVRPLCEHALMSAGQPKKIKTAWSMSPDKTATIQAPGVQKEMFRAVPSSQQTEETAASTKEAKAKQYVLFTGHKDATEQLEGLVMNKQESLKNKLFTARFIGSFLKKYLFYESGSSLLLVDQHAAQERIAYEQLLKQIESGKIETQQLLTPLVMQLSTQEMLVWDEAKEKLEEIGLSTTLWDKESIAIHAHPELISTPEISVRNILAGEQVARCNNEMLARWACRSSIMAGDEVQQKAAEYLCKRLLECDDPFTCPHGRPTVVEIEEKFLNKQFLRG